jgi:hypothetical protein
MENPSRPAQAELERYATLWGLARLAQVNEDDRLSDRELLVLHLTCSLSFVDWTRVYKALPDTRFTLDQLLQAARKAGPFSNGATVDKTWCTCSRQAAVVAQLFAGAAFGTRAKETTLYKELHAGLEPVAFCTDSLEVVAFHLVGVSAAVSVVEDVHSPFVQNRVPVARREILIEVLTRLRAKWSTNNAEQVSMEAAVMIEDCQYPFLDGLSGKYTVMSALQRNAAIMVKSMMRVPSSSPAPRTATGTIKVLTSKAWTKETERAFADNPRLQRYKRRKGWQPFYPSRATVLAYLNDMVMGDEEVRADCMTMTSPEWIQFVERLAPYVQTDIFTQRAQGKDFVAAMTITATHQQVGNWSTLDAAKRMLVVCHPDWQTHYAHGWSLDRPTLTEIAKYRRQWPTLPDPLLMEAQEDAM